MASLIQIVNLRNARMVLRNIAKVGPVATFQYVLSDLMFDLKYGTDTVNTIMLDELDIDSANKVHGRYYEGTNAYVFGQVFSQIKIDPLSSCFVDFGSGKGKAMMLAAERGFRKVIGVEFSGQLVEACRQNLQTFQRKTKSRTVFDVVQMDAAMYEIPAEANLLYFANPFDEVMCGKVIENILLSLQKCPREIVIIHLHPQGNMAFANCPDFRLENESQYGYLLRAGPGNSPPNG